MSEKLAIIILAAGNSSRLGQPKQLVELNDESLLVRQCKMALTFTENVSCVFGFRAQDMVDEVSKLSIKTIINETWKNGLSSSIAYGASEIDDDVDAVMLLLVDQWLLDINKLKLILKQWRDTPQNIISASKVINDKEILGPPVIFPRYCFSQLSQLSTGNGAKMVINKHKNKLSTVNMQSAFVDLDTPEQLLALQNYQSSQQKN
jgi:molybdenum cofactor cytidylyltransferase